MHTTLKTVGDEPNVAALANDRAALLEELASGRYGPVPQSGLYPVPEWEAPTWDAAALEEFHRAGAVAPELLYTVAFEHQLRHWPSPRPSRFPRARRA